MEDDQYLDEMLNKIIITKSQLEANEYIRLVKNYIYVTNKYTNLKKVDYLIQYIINIKYFNIRSPPV